MPNEVTVKMLVWILYAAVAAAVLYTYVMQKMLVKLVKRLIAHGAESPETACTLEQLDFTNPLTQGLLAHFAASGSTLSRSVVRTERAAPTANEKTGGTQVDEAELLFREKTTYAYYLPPEGRTKSFEKHLGSGQSPFAIAGLLIALFLVATVASGVISFLGNWASGLVERDSTPGVYGTANTEESLLEEQEKLNEEEREREEQEKAEAEANADRSDEETDGAESETADVSEPTDSADEPSLS